MRRDPLNTVALVYDGLCTFEFGLVVELFGLPRPEFENWYRFRVAGVGTPPYTAIGGVTLTAPFTLRALDRAGTIIIPGWSDLTTCPPEGLLRKLRRAAQQGARLLSVCSGAHVLASAGLLDGKRATTHWRYVAEFARRFPEVAIDADVLYVEDGNILTSAGSAAGLDMGLHLIRKDFGAHVANAVARRLVLPPYREGGQKQFIATPVSTLSLKPESHNTFAQFLEDLRKRLCEDHTVAQLARQLHMSPRNFARRFKEVTGTTPHRWIQIERVKVVQEQLETTAASLEIIAERVGFADAQIMRLHFKRVVGTSPSNYRKSFREVEP